MKSQFNRKAKPEPSTTSTAIKPKTTIKLEGPKPISTTVVVKRQNCCQNNDGAAGVTGGGNADGKNTKGNFRGGNTDAGKPKGRNFGGASSRANNSGGANAGRRGCSRGCNNGKESYQFVPVRRKPLGDYMLLEEPTSSSLPTTSSSQLPNHPHSMSYAAAVESHPVSKLKIKVVLSPRVKRINNQQPVKRPSPKSSPGARVKMNPPTQSKPHIVHQVIPKWNMAQIPLQSRAAQGSSNSPINSSPATGSKKWKNSRRSRKALQRQRAAEAASIDAHQLPQESSDLQSSSSKFSDVVTYLDYHHERMQRILAQQTAGQQPYPNRGQVKSCKNVVELPGHRSLFDFDDRLFKRGDLEATALLAQNKAMLHKWLNPSTLIS
ncbi:uncharacterized protein LOC108114239 [Drosophila eugracilis]|uniref:uncharacterized protein LOC108114239 n=1 Tax=Drosophila eugracilis TaxID=29029 RepID=UPI0007E7790E|nr:uncharacterized protein LOC108114239 [Drosophila eugracilis]